LDQLKDQMEEEQSNRDELQRLLNKAQSEAAMWRQKAESGEGSVRQEELDELKRKYNAKIAELEAQLEAALAKASSLEKVKNRLQGEMDDLMVEVDKVRYYLVLVVCGYFITAVITIRFHLLDVVVKDLAVAILCGGHIGRIVHLARQSVRPFLPCIF